MPRRVIVGCAWSDAIQAMFALLRVSTMMTQKQSNPYVIDLDE